MKFKEPKFTLRIEHYNDLHWIVYVDRSQQQTPNGLLYFVMNIHEGSNKEWLVRLGFAWKIKSQTFYTTESFYLDQSPYNLESAVKHSLAKFKAKEKELNG